MTHAIGCSSRKVGCAGVGHDRVKTGAGLMRAKLQLLAISSCVWPANEYSSRPRGLVTQAAMSRLSDAGHQTPTDPFAKLLRHSLEHANRPRLAEEKEWRCRRAIDSDCLNKAEKPS